MTSPNTPRATRVVATARVTLASAALAAAAGVAGCASGDAPAVTFDGARALEYIRLQVDAGPRIPGTETHRLVGDRIVAVLRENADTVMEQRWTHVTAAGDSLPMRNIFAQFNPQAERRILYVTHWDTRPHADKSFAVADRTRPVPGANDGASGTAMLLVLAEALKANPTTLGVDLFFTDGEDYGDFGPPEVDVLIGARYYANNILPHPDYRPMFAVLWDMIGDADLRILREEYSQQAAPEVNDRVWRLAASLGYRDIFVDAVTPVIDDHIPLIEKGFRIVNVIDIDYPAHHTTADTMDKVSARSLEIVGRVALGLIRQEER